MRNPGEEVRPRRRRAQLAQDRAARCRVRAHQLERPGVVGAEPPERGDRDREEGQVGRHDRDAEPVGLEPDDDERRDGDDRDGLAGHDDRDHRALEQPDVYQHDRQRQAQERSEGEADGRVPEREQRGADQARERRLAVRVDVEELHRDDPGVGQRHVRREREATAAPSRPRARCRTANRPSSARRRAP